MSERFCLVITGLIEGVLDSRCESSNHVLLQDLMRSAPKQLPTQDRGGETAYQTSRLLQRDEVSWSGVIELMLPFHYTPIPVGRALILYAFYEMSSYTFLQIFDFVASFTTFASLHIIPSPRHPVHLHTRLRCTIWKAVCRWSWNPHVELLASRC